MFFTKTFSTNPPLSVLVLIRMARSKLGLSILQFLTYTLRTPAEISLPITTPPWPSFIIQSSTTMFSLGIFTLRPSSFLPDLIAIQSSPVSNTQFLMCTFLLYSGSQPSLLGPWLLTVTPSTVTLLHLIGCITQKGALIKVTPCIRTFSQSKGSMKVGRR